MIGANLQLRTYKWTGLKFKSAGKLPIILEEIIEYTQFIKGKLEDVNM